MRSVLVGPLLLIAAAIASAQPVVASSFCDYASSDYVASRRLLLREGANAAAAAATVASTSRLLKPDAAGYVEINASAGSALYYAYFEARETRHYEERERPVLLWLQVELWLGRAVRGVIKDKAATHRRAAPPINHGPSPRRKISLTHTRTHKTEKMTTTQKHTQGRPRLRVDVWPGVRARPRPRRRAPRRAAALQPPLLGARLWAVDRRPARRRRLQPRRRRWRSG
jgi:hypothetical protein